jgi:thioredoxin reductase (NADPH)
LLAAIFASTPLLVHNGSENPNEGRVTFMHEIAIIGAGPTGASAALFTAKAGKKTLVIDSDQSVTKRAWVENHYGVSEVSGPELVDIGKKQAAKFGAELVQGKVIHIEKTADGFKLETEEGSFEAKHVILATGLSVDLAQKIGINTKDGTEPRIKTVLDVDSSGKTNVAGIWAAGTVAGVSMHTIITAGDGAKVAINVISEINGTRYVDHDVMKA